MANFIITNQLSVSINGTNVSSDVTAFAVEGTAATQDKPSFGNTWMERLFGLKDAQVTISFNQNYATSGASAVVNPLLGSYATVVASGTLGGTAVAGTAVCAVSTVQPIGGAVGDISVQNLTWPTHGTVTGFGL